MGFYSEFRLSPLSFFRLIRNKHTKTDFGSSPPPKIFLKTLRTSNFRSYFVYVYHTRLYSMKCIIYYSCPRPVLGQRAIYNPLSDAIDLRHTRMCVLFGSGRPPNDDNNQVVTTTSRETRTKKPPRRRHYCRWTLLSPPRALLSSRCRRALRVYWTIMKIARRPRSNEPGTCRIHGGATIRGVHRLKLYGTTLPKIKLVRCRSLQQMLTNISRFDPFWKTFHFLQLVLINFFW